jgi:hypothetical protein
MNRVFNVVAIVAFALIAATSLYPFRFRFDGALMEWKIFALRPGTDLKRDMFENTVLYLPLGYGISGFFAARRQRPARALCSAVIMALVTSYTFEALQTFLPGRFPSWKDVTANVLGSAFGALAGLVAASNRAGFLAPVYVISARLRRFLRRVK